MKRLINCILLSLITLLSYGQTPNNLIVSNINPTDVLLIWDDGGCTSNYTIRIKELSASTWQAGISVPNNGGSTSHQLNNLLESTTYNWKVKCGNGWTNGPDFTTPSSCLKTITQSLTPFSPDPLTGYMQWSYDTLTISNTSVCDINLRPEFIISHQDSSIEQGDLTIKWFNPYIGNWPDIPYNINGNGKAYGFWSSSSTDSTGIILNPGVTQTMIIKVRFTNSNNNPNISLAPFGTYTAQWTTKEVDASGAILQTLAPADSVTLSLVDCNNFTLNFSSLNITCFGENNGVATIDAINNGSGNYSYQWNNGNSTNVINNLSAGNYNCNITDLSWGCTASAGFIITEPTNLTAIAYTTDLLCYGDSNGVATLTINGGIAPYTEEWNGSSQYNLSAGDYFYTVTDDNGCTFSDSISIYQPTALNSNIVSTDLSSCTAPNGAIDLSVNGGSGAYSYNWNNNATSEDLNNLPSGTYTVIISDTNNCNITNSVVINDFYSIINTSLSSPLFNGFNILCNGDNNGVIFSNTSGGIGPLTFQWSDGQNTINAHNLLAGEYSLIVTDSLGCTAIDSITLTQASPVTSSYLTTNISCFGINDGSAIVNFFGGATGSLQGDTNYILGWAGTPQPVYLPFPQTIFNTTLLPAPYNSIPAGIYPYTVTDLNGCTIYDTITLTEPDSLYSTYSTTFYNGYEISCNGINDGEIDIQVNGGTAPFDNYLNSALQSGLISSGLSAGNYTDSIVDANGCVTTNTIILNEPNSISTTLNPSNLTCYGICDGEIESVINGGVMPYTYLWSNLDTAQNIQNLCTGNYSLTLTDNNNCSEFISTTITQPSPISASIDSTLNVSTYGGIDGEIHITTNGGSGNLIPNWTATNGFTSNNNDITNLSAGFYFITITDTNLCTLSDTIEITQPSSLWMNLNNIGSINCFDSCNGSLAINVNGGDSLYTFNWTGPNNFISTSQNIDNLCYGEYIITMSDLSTTLIDTFNIYQPQPLSSIITSDTITCHNESASAEVLIYGGTSPFQYNWSNGDTNQFTNLFSGNYTVVITDINGCIIADSLTLTNPDSISITSSVTNISCNGMQDGEISLTINNGGTAPFQYSINNGISYQSSNIFYNLSAGISSFLITDINGCNSTIEATITEPLVLNNIISSSNVTCFGECDGTANVNANGGTAPYSYDWGGVNPNNLCAGLYNLATTDANGCLTSNTIIITEPNPVLVNIWIDGNSIFATNGFTSYQWYDNNHNPILGANDSIFTPQETGNYYVTVTDTNGCSESSYFVEYTLLSITDYFSNLKVFPNPTNKYITISSKHDIKWLHLYNAMGNQLLSVDNNTIYRTETKLDLSTFAKGVYLLKINIENQIINHRIILQ